MQKWKIGDVTVTKVVEMEAFGHTAFILPQATREAVGGIEWMRPHFMKENGDLIMSIHALIVETPDRRIIVDTCIGNDKPREMERWNMLDNPFLADLAAAGCPRESIDTVMCTHLHVDHVGWNTMLENGRWVPTFPNARYLMARSEFDYWATETHDESQKTILADSVRPVVDAGLSELVDTEHVICDEVRLIPTHGHTPGHVSVLISSKGEEALITGDFIHHPCQLVHVDWSSTVDFDPDAAAATRHRMFERYADTPTLIIGTHFAGATAGRLVRDGDAYRLDI